MTIFYELPQPDLNECDFHSLAHLKNLGLPHSEFRKVRNALIDALGTNKAQLISYGKSEKSTHTEALKKGNDC